MKYFRENINKMSGYTPGFQPTGAGIVKLNTNENPYPTSPLVMQTLRRLTEEHLRRYPQPLGQKFRLMAAKTLGFTPDNIMCTNGGDDLLTICFRAFCDENRGAAYPGPTYSLYPVLAQLQSCPTTEVKFDKAKFIDKLIETNAALTIVCNPNAPTGRLISSQDLAKLAAKLDGILLIDEAYTDFANENCLSLVNEFENVIILRSMSKGYSLAGIRFGFCVAQPTIINQLMKVKDSYNVDTVAIESATAAMADQRHFADNVKKIIAERDRLTNDMRKLGFEVLDSQANFILTKCIECKAKDVYEKLAEQNIFVRYFNLPGLKDNIRITVGTAEQNDILLNALKKITTH